MLSVELAGLRDLLFVRRLRNDPISQKWSSTQERIGIFRHIKWWLARRRSAELVFIVVLDGKRIGYTRCRPGPDGISTISIALSSDFRGRGHGPEAIEKTVAAAAVLEGSKGWRAIAHSGNAASIRAFERAGFRLDPGRTQSSLGFVALHQNREQWIQRQGE